MLYKSDQMISLAIGFYSKACRAVNAVMQHVALSQTMMTNAVVSLATMQAVMH